jgi:hypothetical protein
MVDPRIYRAALVLVAFALIIFGFSFEDQPAPAVATTAPIPFSAGDAATALRALAGRQAAGAPGSPADDRLAAYVSRQLHRDGFSVSSSDFRAQTLAGERTLRTVIGTRPGLTGTTIAVLANRDRAAGLSGTALLLELARVLSGETQHRSLMLVSTSGSAGAAGTTEVARALAAEPVDAVIVLGDVAGAHPVAPAIVPWSAGQALAPPLLRDTLAAYLRSDAGLQAGHANIGAQLAHLALPLSTTAQGPFGAGGIPAVLLSTAGMRERAPAGSPDPARLAAIETAVLQTVNALDTGPRVPAAVPYLLINGEVVPVWAVRLLVLALIAPVLLCAVDAVARARRRGHSMARWLAWVLAGAVPFLAALALVAAARAGGWLPATTPAPLASPGVPLGSSGVALLASIAGVVVLALALARPLCIRLADAVLGREDLVRAGRPRAGRPSAASTRSQPGDGAAVALLVVIVLTALVVWAINPFAAALLVPALHLWLWLAHPALRGRRAALGAIVLGGLAAPALVVAYQAHALGLSGAELPWTGVLLIAGGQLGGLLAVCWALALGCFVSALAIIARSSRPAASEEPAITVRGPVTYAGPGSLGGTKSALRR